MDTPVLCHLHWRTLQVEVLQTFWQVQSRRLCSYASAAGNIRQAVIPFQLIEQYAPTLPNQVLASALLAFVCESLKLVLSLQHQTELQALASDALFTG